MLLTYIDESGTSYEEKDGGFVDGPYIFYCGLLLPENKYFQLERLYYKIFSRILEIKNFEEKEIHATEIWKNAEDGTIDKKQVLKYFEELFQLLSKLKIRIVVGAQKKTSVKKLKEEHEQCIYSFLHALEHTLSEMEETSLLIADENEDKLLKDIFYQKTLWRYNPGGKIKEPFSKYEFESFSCFLLDQIHYSDSKKSLFIQLADQITFIIRRMATFYYLKQNGLSVDKEKNPLSEETFNFFIVSSKMILAYFNESEKDVFIDQINNVNDFKRYLPDLR